mmetsp:Transcript_56803/g.164816  ORF Transcript_56803/g.164816 Transcript_56803/m.164816 type:complete len:201 (-) Transcript_56803:1098-1700(-)
MAKLLMASMYSGNTGTNSETWLLTSMLLAKPSLAKASLRRWTALRGQPRCGFSSRGAPSSEMSTSRLSTIRVWHDISNMTRPKLHISAIIPLYSRSATSGAMKGKVPQVALQGTRSLWTIAVSKSTNLAVTPWASVVASTTFSGFTSLWQTRGPVCKCLTAAAICFTRECRSTTPKGLLPVSRALSRWYKFSFPAYSMRM